MDTLTIKGQGRRLGHDELMSNREYNLIKEISGAVGDDVPRGFINGDAAVRMALAIVVLERAGKRVEHEILWNAKADWAVWEFGAEMTEEIENPQEGIETTTGSSSMPTNGGETLGTTAENQDVDPPRIGYPDSGTYAESA